MLKSHSIGSGNASYKNGTLFVGNAGSHFVILLYSETLLQVLLGIYCKRFQQIPLFTILLFFYVFEVGKAKSVTQSVLMILTLNGLLQKNFQVYFTFGNSRQNKASPLNFPQNYCVTPFRNFKAENQDPWKFHIIFS